MSAARPIALTMGEPAGIGPEIIVRAAAARPPGAAPLLVFADVTLLRPLAEKAGLRLAEVSSAGGPFADGVLSVRPVPLPSPATPGHPIAAHAGAIVAALDAAIEACVEGKAAALVTAPIQKATLYQTGFPAPGHTEYIAARLSPPGRPMEPLMLMAGAGLKIGLVTIHVPLRAVSDALGRALIARKGRLLDAALKADFGIVRPRIAVAALNPHAGEAGALGREEIDVIAPAIADLKSEGILAHGPLPADTLFHAGARARFDGVLAMYHDQALIPIKTLDFAGGINITAGLPIVRTSPDHGTALDIAGQGVADASSLIAAIAAAEAIAERRAGRPLAR